jgi:tRNA-Thr(GGU) m(6)t(6)A37 methyltransferase TsaA
LSNFKCENCRKLESVEEPKDSKEVSNDSIVFKSIGTIKTIFSEKRAVPRQANVADQILSKIELSPEVLNNPGHSLEGLEGFSHFWVIYHFHKNEGHSKAKVMPPRLNGEKVGVFSTRSPHRPNAIGISLVQLDHIEESVIYFYGTDMVNDTPVLDIKPYIPQYDNPVAQPQPTTCPEREEPEGQETENSATASKNVPQGNTSPVRVPEWITNKPELTVIFSETASTQLQELAVEKVQT